MTLLERDAASIWHPYTQPFTAPVPIPLVRAEKEFLYDENGNAYIDAISSWWVNLHGHSHPYMVKKISEQVAQLDHVIFAGFTHPPAVMLAERLLAKLRGCSRIFYSDNGSTAVEVALKMSLQYFQNTSSKRKKIIAFRNAYHGDTFGAMSVSGRSSFTAAFNEYLFDVIFITPPSPGKEEQSVKEFYEAISEDVAAFIFEPLIQGAAGMVMHEAAILDELIRKAQSFGTLAIADEVFTGFGRTGKFFACDHLNSTPDIVCLSKGLTGGVMPLGVTACSEKIYSAFVSSHAEKTFYHGHSFTANPVACAASLASYDLLSMPETWQNIGRIEQSTAKFVELIRELLPVIDVRQTGTVMAIELKTKEATGYLNSLRKHLYDYFIAERVIIRPLGNVIYTVPPYCISEESLQRVFSVIKNCIQNIQHENS